MPVLEADFLTVGTTTGRNDDAENDETDNRQDLDTGKPELGLAVCTRAENVDADDDQQTDRDPDTVVDGLVPEIDEDGGSGKFGGENDGPVAMPISLFLGLIGAVPDLLTTSSSSPS